MIEASGEPVVYSITGMRMGNNDHCFSQPGDRGSTPFVLPMNTVVIPTDHREMIFVYIGGSQFMPTVLDLEAVRDWVQEHKDTWPKCFHDLCVAFYDFPLSMEIYPALNPNQEYVFVLETEYNMAQSDIKNWSEILAPRNDESFTIFVYSDYFESIKRINRNLLPFM